MLTRSRPLPRNAALDGSKVSPTSATAAGTSSAPESLLWAAVLFNCVLCFVDTNLFTMNPLAVIAAEAAILGLAFLVPFSLGRRLPGRMDFLLLLLLATWLLLSFFRQSLELKFFRDVAIIPIFVILGMASHGVALHRRLFWLHMIILGFAVWEAISVESLVSFFSIGDYFANTRGLNPDDWWIENGLYLSSIRPETRFLFPSLPLHRLSSVFLEPVSLGNYVIIATIWLTGFRRQIPRQMWLIAVFATLLLLIGSDSRMASATCLVVVALAPLRNWIPQYVPILTAPIVIAAMFLAVSIFGLESGTDDFGGRLAYSVDVFRTFGLEDYAGLSLDHINATQDAGFAYVFVSQSLIVALILWGCLFVRSTGTPESKYVHLAVAVYLSLNLTVSWSLFSIKTAALLWFLLGRGIREDIDANSFGAPGLRRLGKSVGVPGPTSRVRPTDHQSTPRTLRPSAHRST